MEIARPKRERHERVFRRSDPTGRMSFGGAMTNELSKGTLEVKSETLAGFLHILPVVVMAIPTASSPCPRSRSSSRSASS